MFGHFRSFSCRPRSPSGTAAFFPISNTGNGAPTVQCEGRAGWDEIDNSVPGMRIPAGRGTDRTLEQSGIPSSSPDDHRRRTGPRVPRRLSRLWNATLRKSGLRAPMGSALHFSELRTSGAPVRSPRRSEKHRTDPERGSVASQVLRITAIDTSSSGSSRPQNASSWPARRTASSEAVAVPAFFAAVSTRCSPNSSPRSLRDSKRPSE